MNQLMVVCFNGPPSSGKDTGALAVYQDKSTSVCTKMWERFSSPLKIAYHGLFGMHRDVDWKGIGPFEQVKDERNPLLDHVSAGPTSYREFQIAMSEDFMKEQYGDDIFGRLAAWRIRESFKRVRGDAIVCIPDSGFYQEAVALREGLPDGDFILFRVHREGTSFSGDSRSHIEIPPGYKAWDVYNQDKHQYESFVKKIVEQRYIFLKTSDANDTAA